MHKLRVYSEETSLGFSWTSSWCKVVLLYIFLQKIQLNTMKRFLRKKIMFGSVIRIASVAGALDSLANRLTTSAKAGVGYQYDIPNPDIFATTFLSRVGIIIIFCPYTTSYMLHNSRIFGYVFWYL